MSSDHQNYRVHVRRENYTGEGWGEPMWEGEATGHDDALDTAFRKNPERRTNRLRILTCCIGPDYNSVREWRMNIAFEEIA